MWSHRNNFLHDHLTSTSQTEQLALNEEIECEWQKGVETLPPPYHSLFQGTFISQQKTLASNSLVGKGIVTGKLFQ